MCYRKIKVQPEKREPTVSFLERKNFPKFSFLENQVSGSQSKLRLLNYKTLLLTDKSQPGLSGNKGINAKAGTSSTSLGVLFP